MEAEERVEVDEEDDASGSSEVSDRIGRHWCEWKQSERERERESFDVAEGFHLGGRREVGVLQSKHHGGEGE